MNQDLSMNANQLVAFLQKPTSEFTKADIISFIQQKDIRTDGRSVHCQRECFLQVG